MEISDPKSNGITFISHASADQRVALELVNHLEQKGLRCWIAPRDIRASHTYGLEISRGIDQARCLVLLVSEPANHSAAVRNEVELAFRRGKPIFPIRIEDVPPGPELEFFISSLQWIDVWKGRLTDYIEYIADAIQHGEIPQKPPKISSRQRFRRLLPAIIILVATTLGIGLYHQLGALHEDIDIVTKKGGEGSVGLTARELTSEDFKPGLFLFSTLSPGSAPEWFVEVKYSPRLKSSSLFNSFTEGSYSLNGRDYLPGVNIGSFHISNAFDAKHLYLRFSLWNGQTVGPFEYNMDFRQFANEKMKDKLSAIEPLAKCSVIPTRICRLDYRIEENALVLKSIEYAFNASFSDPTVIAVARNGTSRDSLGIYTSSDSVLPQLFEVPKEATVVFLRLIYEDGEAGAIQRITISQ
jgi:hypothetical protein